MALSSTEKKRVVVGIAGTPFVIALVNVLVGTALFGGYDVTVLVVAAILLFVVMSVFGPSIEELKLDRERRRNK